MSCVGGKGILPLLKESKFLLKKMKIVFRRRTYPYFFNFTPPNDVVDWFIGLLVDWLYN
jgi:hypothetical protein